MNVMLTPAGQIKMDGLKRQEDAVKSEIDETWLESIFLSRADCMLFIKLKFGIETNKNITFNADEHIESLFMKCENFSDFKLVAKVKSDKFVFVINECCVSNGNENNLSCTSTFKVTTVNILLIIVIF